MPGEERLRDIDWSKAERFPERGGPVVFMFQPTHYKVVETPEELRLWEQMMIDRVGLDRESPTLARRAEMMSGRETISGKAPLTMDD